MFALINIGHMKGVEYSLLSPDGKLEVRFVRTDKGTFEYKFSMGNKLVIDSSPIGYYMTNGNKIPGNDWIIANRYLFGYFSQIGAARCFCAPFADICKL